MIGKSLFHRFFWRYLMTLILALMLLIFLTHWYQARHIRHQQGVLDRQAEEICATWEPGSASLRAVQWREIEDLTRLVIMDDQWRMLGDSHPERGENVLEYLRMNHHLNHAMTAVAPLEDGARVILIRPYVLRLPQIIQPRVPWLFNAPQWRLIAILFALAILISLLLYPLVRGLSRTFRELGLLAEQVADGHFGKELEVKRKDELGGLVDAFNHMSRKLAEAEQLNHRLIHDVSHELRSPLGRIRVLADTLRFRPESSEQCVEEIHREVALLDRMVEDLVQSAKMEASTETLKIETFNLTKWARSLSDRLAKQIKARGIYAQFNQPKTDIVVVGDRQRLTQAVSNLVENALDATERSDGAQIQVDFAVREEVWEIRVRDNGVGIPEENQPFVFRRFYRVDKHRNREDGGVGLGLSIVKAIVGSHNGEVLLQSKPGEETQVTMRFPLTEANSN